MKRSNLVYIVKTLGALLAVPILVLSQPIFAQDQETAQLRQRVTQLEKRIEQLERLLNECMAAQKEGTSDDYGWQNKMNWRKLEMGMSQEEVRSVLGKPTKVIQGVKTLWYYPNIYGGFVSFDKDGHLAGWNEP